VARIPICRLSALALLGVAACGKKRDSRLALVVDDTTTPASATIVQPMPTGGSFTGEEGKDRASSARADGAAEWGFELDSLDLRRKVTIRIALRTPESAVIVLRAVDGAPPAPGTYRVMLPSTGASHHDPRTFRADIHTTESGTPRSYAPTASSVDSVFIEMPVDGGADSTIRGRIRLQGASDGATRSVAGTFVAPQSMSAGPNVIVTPEMQEHALRRALDGFMMTNAGSASRDGSADSTKKTALARRFLEGRWRDAAVVDSVFANGSAYHVRLRGRFVPTTCEVDSADPKIVCR